MSENTNQKKAAFINFISTSLESISSDVESAKAYLESEGLKPDALIASGLRKIKRMELKLNAEKTRAQQNSINRFMERAAEIVERIKNTPGFSLSAFLVEKKIVASFRKLESLSSENMNDLMIKYYANELKMSEENKNDES